MQKTADGEPIDNDTVKAEVRSQQQAKGQTPPELVWLKACHSAEGTATEPSMASRMAKETHNYVLGSIGACTPVTDDDTHPLKEYKFGRFEFHIPITELHTGVELFGPDGKPVHHFKSPVDWKEVKAYIKAHPAPKY